MANSSIIFSGTCSRLMCGSISDQQLDTVTSVMTVDDALPLDVSADLKNLSSVQASYCCLNVTTNIQLLY